MKYLGISVIKYTQIYMRKTITLLKYIKDQNYERGIPCSHAGRLNTVKMYIFPKIALQIQHDSNQKHSKSLCGYHKPSFKLTQEAERPRVGKTILEENGAGGQTHNRATVIKTASYPQKKKPRQQTRREPRNTPT